ncbi:MAG: hypothetical protein ACREQW_10355 [Candidatus Binatia bacterium]
MKRWHNPSKHSWRKRAEPISMDPPSLDYARAKGFHEATIKRLASLAQGDQHAFMGIVGALGASENHARDLLDWLQEIALRDGITMKDVLAQEALDAIVTDPRLGRNDKLKRVKQELRKMRFPRLSRIETEITKRIQALKLKPQAQVAVPVGLEGGFLTLQLKARSYQELRQLLAELAEAAEKTEVREIFELLDGGSVPERIGKR